MSCAIWQTAADVEEQGLGDFQIINSARAGGKYWISCTASSIVATFTDQAKLLLTSWLCEQRRMGVGIPEIDSDVLTLVGSRRPLTVSERLRLALLCLEEHTPRLGTLVELMDDKPELRSFLAQTECLHGQELGELMRLLGQRGLIDAKLYSGGGHFRILADGWTELDALRRPNIGFSQAFVAMWFHPSTNDAYVEGIAPAITENGYSPLRIDKKDHNNKIDDEIIAEIRRSRFIVADFTCAPNNVRGGVYFEAGFAQGIGIPVIWSCKDTSVNDLHFDTRQYAHIVWENPADLYKKLKSRIGATVGDGPLPSR